MAKGKKKKKKKADPPEELDPDDMPVAEPIEAEEAWRLGALVRVVPHTELMPAALREAAVLAAKIPMGLRLAKENLNAVEWMDVKNGYRFEQTRTELLSQTADATEARAAVREKRRPVFRVPASLASPRTEPE